MLVTEKLSTDCPSCINNCKRERAMITNVIQMKLKKGKADDLKDLYQRHFKALKDADDKVKSYDVYIDRKDDTLAYTVKTFDTESNLKAHNESNELERFFGELKELIEGGADYHECTQIVSL